MNNNPQSLVRRILNSEKPFVFYHTHIVNEENLQHAIAEEKSMDLDVSIDDEGNPYLGHSPEYHRKSGEPYFDSVPLWRAVDLISKSNIAVMVDCKHYDAWPVIEEIVEKIGPERCRVGSYVSELKFEHSRGGEEPDYLTDWSPAEKLRLLKEKYPAVTTVVYARWLPNDLLVSGEYKKLIEHVRDVVSTHHVDSVSLNIPYETVTNEWLRYFRIKNIIPAINVNNIDTTKLTEVYIGETDYLENASNVTQL